MWKYSVLAAFSVLIAGCGAAYDTHPEQSDSPLKTALGKNRLLIVCTGDDTGPNGTPLYGAQYEQVQKDWPGYLERDLIFVWLRDQSVTSWTPFMQEDGSVSVRQLAERGDVASLRELTACKFGSRGVHLIGKDTGLKKSWPVAVSNAALFAIIDAMPMRQREMRSD